MTIKIPEPGLLDRLLRTMGKKRGVRLAGPASGAAGPYSHATAVKESFWKALLRPKTADLPDGMADLFALRPGDRE